MRRFRSYIALLILAIIAFWPLVLHPTETLYSNTSDFLAQHVPAKYFLVRSLRETGELPLWNPEQYAGSPFVHDIQVGLFYPPHVPLYFISEPAIGPFLSWLVFAHVLLAGWFMNAYARHAGLTELGAFIAGLGFMLSPRWMMQLFVAGHTITQGICWVPLVLFCVERAIIRENWRWALVGGVAYAMLILGTHPQWTFYASLLIGFWPLRLLVRERAPKQPESETLKADYGEPGRVSAGSLAPRDDSPTVPALPALTRPGSPLAANKSLFRRKLLIRWFLAEAIVVAIGLALCAVQLLPTIEAAGESSRARGMAQSWSLDGAKAAATTLIGPIPDKRPESIHWETRGGIGFTWAIFAIVGIRLGGRKAIVPAIVAGAMLAYALGGSYFIDRLPGFNNFRMPTRMLLTLAFPVAFLAGVGVESLNKARAKAAIGLATVIWAIVVVDVGTIAFVNKQFGFENRATEWRVYWPVVVIGWTWFLLHGIRLANSHRFAIALLLADLLIVTLPYPSTRTSVEIYPPSPIIDYIREHNRDGHRVYDFEQHGSYHVSLFGTGSPVASIYGIPSIRGYNPLDVARYRQFLAFISNNGERQAAFAGAFTHPVTTDYDIVNRSLFLLLGVRYEIRSLENRHQWLLKFAGDEFHWTPSPRSFNFLVGMQNLSTQYLYESHVVFPRAFMASTIVQQPSAEPDVLQQLQSIDLQHFALVEPGDSGMPNMPTINNPPGPARIRSHSPNEIRIDLDGRTTGLLVLTDPWYPGWVCRVDGQEVPIWKADYAFRGVMVPEGSREVVFHFEPKSYRRGKWISLATLFVVAILLTASLRKRSNSNVSRGG